MRWVLWLGQADTHEVENLERRSTEMLRDLAMPVEDVEETVGSYGIEWEQLKSTGGQLSAFRAKVPGGWLIYVGNGYQHHGGVTFYPDPAHFWTGESLS